ncbi:hypothetical protein F908_03013 [Acinetobacter sp. NIPH 284]|jgi:hypothetical protein|nr:hypothetical protein F908_03013 [Acinetobacter sp. NIPH 284]MCT9265946.1 hypothetical protein [Acinetobacter baumannii]
MTKSTENIEKKIEAQLEKLKQLKAQKQAIEARERTKKKEQERKDDTRRKILLGSYLIKKMNANEANKEKILAELNEYLTEDRDRQLFNLSPINDIQEKKYDTFEKEFKSFEEADSFSKRFLNNMNVFTSIKEINGLWTLKIAVEEFSDHYIELADIFYNPSYEELHTDDEDDQWEPDFDSDRKVTDVGLNGYPSGYDTSLTNRY